MQSSLTKFQIWQDRIHEVLRILWPDLPMATRHHDLIGKAFSLFHSLNMPKGEQLFSMVGTISAINAYQVLDAEGAEEDLVVELFVEFQRLPFLDGVITKLIFSGTKGKVDCIWDSHPKVITDGELKYLFGALHNVT